MPGRGPPLQATGSAIRFFDTAQGRPIGEPFTHSLEIKEVALSQVGALVSGHPRDRIRESNVLVCVFGESRARVCMGSM